MASCLPQSSEETGKRQDDHGEDSSGSTGALPTALKRRDVSQRNQAVAILTDLHLLVSCLRPLSFLPPPLLTISQLLPRHSYHHLSEHQPFRHPSRPLSLHRPSRPPSPHRSSPPMTLPTNPVVLSSSTVPSSSSLVGCLTTSLSTDLPATSPPTDPLITSPPTNPPPTDPPAPSPPVVHPTDPRPVSPSTDLLVPFPPTDLPTTSTPTDSPIISPSTSPPNDLPTTSHPTDPPTTSPLTELPATYPSTDHPSASTPTDPPASSPPTDHPAPSATTDPSTDPSIPCPPTSQLTEPPVLSLPTDPPATSTPTDRSIIFPSTSPPTDLPTTSPSTDPPAISPPIDLPATSPSTDPPFTSSTTNPPIPSPSTNHPAPSATTSPSTDPPIRSPPTSPPTEPSLPSLPTSTLADSPSPSPPANCLSVSGPQPLPPSAEVLELEVSDLGALMRLMCHSAHCSSVLGNRLNLGPDLVLSLWHNARQKPIEHLSLVLETRLKRTDPTLSLKVLMEVISQPPISNEALARKVQQFFISDDRVSGPQPPPPSAKALVLTVSDLGTLKWILNDAAHCTSLLGIFLGLGPDLVRSLKDKALGDTFNHLSLVLKTRLKRTNPPLSLKDLTEAISLPPISNEVLARNLEQFFTSDDRRKRLERTISALLSPEMAAYSKFLDDIYQFAAIPPDPKGGPEPSTQYTNLAVIKKEKVSKAEADAFTKATLHGGIDEIMDKKAAIELKDIFKPEEGQAKVDFVLAEGAPGVGKSTLALELCRRRHEIEATKAFVAVVLLKLHEKEVQEAKSEADLLYYDDSDIQQAVVQEICSTSGENILFILDGFDEVPHKIRKSMFVAKIIQGQCLPKATVLVTSRPSARADLLSLRKPDKHIEVLGFTHELIEQYATSVFGSSTALLADFLKYVSTNPAIKTMMYVPLNCAIVVEIYQESREEGRRIPQTMTQLYSELTLSRIYKHHERGDNSVTLPENLEDLAQEHRKVLLSLAELAFNGTLKQVVIFNNLPVGCSTLGLITASQHLHGRRRVSTNYSFFHLSMQEFLSAYHISQLPGSEQKEAFEEYSDKHHYSRQFSHMDVVWKFVAGLTGFEGIGWDSLHSRSRKRKRTTPGGKVPVSPLTIECLYEAQKVQCDLNDILGQTSILSFRSDLAFTSFACGYCVAVSQSTWNVELASPPKAWEMFVYGLASQKEVHGSIGELDLSYNPIGQKGIARFNDISHKLLKKLSVLKVANCELDGSALDQLSDVIPRMTRLTYLDISGNPAGSNGGTVKLLQMVQVAVTRRLHTLFMRNIPIGRDDIMALSHLISPSGGLKELKIGDRHMYYIELLLRVVFSPSSLETLNLWYMKIDTTSLSFKPLKENCNITELEIRYGTIGSRDISCIAEVLRTNTALEMLSIKDTCTPIESDPSQVRSAVGDLANSLKVNRSLREFCLYLLGPDKSLALRKIDACAFIDALQYNQTLTLLELSRCDEYFSDDEHRRMDSRVDLYREGYTH